MPVQPMPAGIVKRAKWWRRRGNSKRGFWYQDSQGERVTTKQHLGRIEALKIPPAWKEVRIAPSSRTPLQAVGLDSRGRPQYLYSARFVSIQEQRKFAKLLRFGERLAALREATNEHISQEGLGKERVLAVVVRLINDLHFRVGTEQSVKEYKTYGITTLRNRHLRVLPKGGVEFQFVGKHKVKWRRLLADPELAALLQEIKALGGSRLFHYVGEDGKPHPIKPADVNNYIKSHMGPEFSAKDFRTWTGTLFAAVALAEQGCADDEKTIKKRIRIAVCHAAEQLGNTPTVCRSSYIHPVIFERYQQGSILSDFRKKAERILRRCQPAYEPEELALLELLREASTA